MSGHTILTRTRAPGNNDGFSLTYETPTAIYRPSLIRTNPAIEPAARRWCAFGAFGEDWPETLSGLHHRISGGVLGYGATPAAALEDFDRQFFETGEPCEFASVLP